MAIETIHFLIILGVVLFFMYYIGRDGCKENCCGSKEGYADQVVHGTVGGIAGPIVTYPPNVPTLWKKWDKKYPETFSI